MSAEWVTVPDGKREHIGVQLDGWQPICGQLSSRSLWFPRKLTLMRRTKPGRCSDCLRVRDAINALGDGSTV